MADANGSREETLQSGRNGEDFIVTENFKEELKQNDCLKENTNDIVSDQALQKEPNPNGQDSNTSANANAVSDQPLQKSNPDVQDPNISSNIVSDQPLQKNNANDNQDPNTPAESSQHPQVEDEDTKHKNAEREKYWQTVDDNPMDFTGWTYLLQYVEQESIVDHCRKAYEAFFSHYPYCYGYWKKYSDMEKRLGDKEKIAEVFEKGIKAIPLSVELWLHYINYVNSEHPEPRDRIKKLYERALAAAGLEFRSDKLWDSYISWENQNGNLCAVTQIYDRLITTPTQLYSHHWDNYKRHINIHHPKDILNIDDFLKIRTKVLNKHYVYEEDDENDVGLDEAFQLSDPTDLDAPPGMSDKGDEREVKKIRAKLIEKKEAIYKANEYQVGKRWAYEESIRRPYFHVKPLERGQLKNWREYLDYEISLENHCRIVVLFERSLIACALYEDFWMKYAKYLELHNIDGVRSVYQRACDIHLPKKPYIHLAWAAFEERKENISLARKILMNIEANIPGLAMVCMRRISLERRTGNHEAAEELFQKYIETAVSHKSRTFFCIKYARYLQKIIGKPDKARKVLTDALEIDKTNERVFLQLLDVEYQCFPVEETRVHEHFQALLASDVGLDFKVKVSQRRMEFLEDFGADIQKISFAYDEHQKLVKEATSKKKKPDKEKLSDEPLEKKAKSDHVTPVKEQPPAPPMPPLGPPPPPDMGYAYNHWPVDGGYCSGAYPGYPYPSYQASYPSGYGYYGY